MGIDSIQITSVWVRDIEAALAFYTEVLGLEKRSDRSFGESGRWVTVAPAGATTEIVLRPAGEHGEAGRFTGIVFGSDDPVTTAAELQERGVRFAGELEQLPSGAVMGEFQDPDGNGFVLHSRG